MIESPGVKGYNRRLSTLLFICMATVSLFAFGLTFLLIEITEAEVVPALVAGLFAGLFFSFIGVRLIMPRVILPIKRVRSFLEKGTVNSDGSYSQLTADLLFSAKSFVTRLQSEAGNSADIESQLFDRLPGYFMAVDTEGKIKYANSQLRKFLGVESKEQLQDTPLSSFISFNSFAQTPVEEVVDSIKNSGVRGSQSWQHIKISDLNQNDEFGDLYVTIETDTGFESSYLFIPKSEYATAEEREDYVSLAAHELRGPLTVIRGYIDIFERELSTSMSDDHKKLLRRLKISSGIMNDHINTILNSARIEQGTLGIEPIPTDWGAELRRVVETLDIRARERGRHLRIFVAKDLPEVSVDRASIYQVVSNIVDNAIKYSNEGGYIMVEAHEKEGMVETTIRDYGVGIPDSALANIFGKYFRSHSSKHSRKGTGLGLYLSYKILEAHHGNIWIRSKEKSGTTVGFTLPTYENMLAKNRDAFKNKDNRIERKAHGWIKNHNMVQR